MSTQLIGLPATDNLYKFLAMSGVALASLSLAYPTQLVNELEIQVVELKAQRSKLEIKNDLLRRQMKLVDSGQINGKTSSAEVATMLKAEAELKSNESDFTASTEKTKLLIAQAHFFNTLGLFGSVTGLCMAALGFFRWYKKVQLPADKKAVAESMIGETQEP